MPKQSRPDDQKDVSAPNQAANKEPAEGSREAVQSGEENGGGITNRPLAEEQANQSRVPPRGENKEGGHA